MDKQQFKMKLLKGCLIRDNPFCVAFASRFDDFRRQELDCKLSRTLVRIDLAIKIIPSKSFKSLCKYVSLKPNEKMFASTRVERWHILVNTPIRL